MQVKGEKISFQFEAKTKQYGTLNNINNAIKTARKKTLTSTAQKFPRLQIYLKKILIYENKNYIHVFSIYFIVHTIFAHKSSIIIMRHAGVCSFSPAREYTVI